MTSLWQDWFPEKYRKVGDKMDAGIKSYKVENPLVLEEINEFLNQKGGYGFGKGDDGSDVLYFFDKKEIFAITYKNGKIELGPNVNLLIINYIENKLKN